MKRNVLILILLFSFSFIYSQNLETCTEAWCYDKEGNLKKELRFDPNTIKWPRHFNGETVKNEAWIHVRYEHHGEIDVVSLQKYRGIINDPSFCEDGVAMHDPFECEYGSSGKPRWKDASCSLVGHSHEVREIRIGSGSCFKKVIDWTVIDWCDYDAKKDNSPDRDDLFLVKDLVSGYSYYAFNDNYGRLDRDGAYHYQQVIKVGDVVQPEILHGGKMHVEVGSSCEIAGLKIGNKAIDSGACPSENFKWTVSLYKEGSKPEILKYTSIGKDSVEVELDPLEVGVYNILWRVNDGCNNPQEAKQIIYVEDKKAPNIFCKGSFSVGVGTPDHPITVWASDFVKSVSDNCTIDENIILSFAKDSVTNALDLTCESHLGDADIAIYATDESGNQSYCLVKSRFSTDDPECQRDVNLNGSLVDQSGKKLPNVSLNVNMSTGGSQVVLTDARGNFSFQKKVPINAEVSITLSSDIIQGKVSTYDLVTIQKHVMKDEMIKDMYDLAAADISGNGSVNPEDIKMLRSYLLGMTAYADVLGNRLLDLSTGLSGKRVDLTKSIEHLELAVVVAGDVID